MALRKLGQLRTPPFRISSNQGNRRDHHFRHGRASPLRIIGLDRMSREFGVEANVGEPQVAYRETILSEAEAEK